MDFTEYERLAGATAIYPERGHNFAYPALGLAGEAGEVCEKLKKVIRDKGNQLDAATRLEIAKELGDVLWYVSQLAFEMQVPLSQVAALNIAKLQSRQERQQLHGDGDNR